MTPCPVLNRGHKVTFLSCFICVLQANIVLLTARIRIDYNSLSSNLKDADDSDEIKKLGDRLQKRLNECMNHIQKINAPNLKAMQKLDMARERLQETDKEFENVRKKARKTKQNFEHN